jgi:hypothetical protein
MRRPIRGKSSSRQHALRGGVVFIRVMLGAMTIYEVRHAKKFGSRKTKTQYKRNNCLSPGGWRGYR